MEFLTRGTLDADNILDGSNNKPGHNIWSKRYPRSALGDILIWHEMAMRIFDVHFPSDHPHHATIRRVLEDFSRRSVFYFTFMSSTEGGREDLRNGHTPEEPIVPLDLFTESALRQITYLRAQQYLRASVDIARFIACYTSIPVNTLYELVDQATHPMCVMDDLMEEIQDQSNPDRYTDIQMGEVNALSVYVMEHIDDLAQQSTGYTSDDIRETMEKCFGTGNIDDARKIKELYKGLDIVRHVGGQMLHSWVSFIEFERKEGQEIGFPPGLFANLFLHMVEYDVSGSKEILEAVKTMKAARLSSNEIVRNLMVNII
ncbi:hypothetical protein TWF694_003019 [Orbilia ellipsospora]|uniref:Uncharacterized protein n=1 Tax=Orbilia ellipsospora TaxID=2528407 RepID=A0AAV9X0D8_9PEZI